MGQGMHMKLEGKVAIITGSTRGIGHAVAMRFAGEGAAVVINGTKPDAVAAVVDEIRQAGGRACGCPGEIGSKDVANQLIDAALGEFGSLHIVVNNAAVSATARLPDLSEEDFDREIRINLRAPFLIAQAAVSRVFIPQSYGKIINVTSHASFRGSPQKTAYTASKMGVIGMTLGWANELLKHKITVNCIAPAAWTDMMENLPENRREKLRESFSQGSVLQRLPLAADVVDSFLFFASDESAFLTGQILQPSGQPMHVL